MLSKSNARALQRKFDNERRMTRRENGAYKIDFTKRLAKAVSIGIFAYITMITGQMAGWIAIPLIYWSVGYGAWAVDKQMEWKWAPWQQ